MQITITTWNINSVRYRIDLVARDQVPGRCLSAQALQAARL
jgi:exonuclease III